MYVSKRAALGAALFFTVELPKDKSFRIKMSPAHTIDLREGGRRYPPFYCGLRSAGSGQRRRSSSLVRNPPRTEREIKTVDRPRLGYLNSLKKTEMAIRGLMKYETNLRGRAQIIKSKKIFEHCFRLLS